MNASPLITTIPTRLTPTRAIDPTILYLGTPVMLLSTLNPDGSTNLAAGNNVGLSSSVSDKGREDGGGLGRRHVRGKRNRGGYPGET